jgi:hypothetical protein
LLDQLAEGQGDLLGRGCGLRLTEQRPDGHRWIALRQRVELLDDLDHRPVRDPLPVREATSADVARVDRSVEVRRQPRLPRLDPAERAVLELVRPHTPQFRLFLEEMFALVRATGDREISVPPTIQALLAARLDRPRRARCRSGRVGRDPRPPPRTGRALQGRARSTGRCPRRACCRTARCRRPSRARARRRTRCGVSARALARLDRTLRLDVHLEVDLAQAVGADPRRAAAIAEHAADRAAAHADAAGEALARVVSARYRLEFEDTVGELDTLVRAATRRGGRSRRPCSRRERRQRGRESPRPLERAGEEPRTGLPPRAARGPAAGAPIGPRRCLRPRS